MQTYYVYFEHIVIINLLLNFLILWLVAKASGLGSSIKRIFLGATFASTYSFLLLFPDLSMFINMFTKFLMSLLMIVVTFWPLSLKKLLQGIISLYLVTFLLGGTVFGLSYFIGDSNFLTSFNILNILSENLFYIVVVTAVIYLAFGRYILTFVNKNLVQGLLKTTVTIVSGNISVMVEAMLDTGNHLRDPVSNYPVIIVEYEAVSDLLPNELRNKGNFSFDCLETLMEKIAGSSMAAKFRIIPFKSVGKSNGLLMGFKPEKIIITKGDSNFVTSKVVIGIFNEKLSPEGNYKALLHPEILKL